MIFSGTLLDACLLISLSMLSINYFFSGLSGYKRMGLEQKLLETEIKIKQVQMELNKIERQETKIKLSKK